MDFDLIAGVAVLERTPPTLRAMIGGLPGAWTDATEGPDTWSPYVIVGHLIHGERTDWIARAEIILKQGADRRFTPYDRFAQFRESEANHWRSSSMNSPGCAPTISPRSRPGG